MDRSPKPVGSKAQDRKQKREQPQQTRMSRSKTPPPLQKYDPTEKELDRWRVIQLQHKALFRGRAMSPSSGENSPKSNKFAEPFPRAMPTPPTVNKVPSELVNKLPPTISHPVDSRYIKRKLEQVKLSSPLPRLEIDPKVVVTDSLSPGNSLLEQAEFLLAKRQVELGADSAMDYEVELRKIVESLHEVAIRDKSEKWSEERNTLIAECAALETRKQQLEELLRKQTVVTGTKGGDEEIARLTQMNAEMRDQIHEKDFQIQDQKATIDALNSELEERNEKERKKDERHAVELQELQKRMTMTENEQIETLTRDLALMKDKFQQMRQENEQIHKRWKGESEDLEDLYREAEVAKRQVALELRELESARKRLDREQEALAKQREELRRQKAMGRGNRETMGLQEKEAGLPKNAESLSLYLDAVLNTAANNIVKIARGQSTESDTNPLAEQIRELMTQPEDSSAIVPQLQTMKRVLESLHSAQEQRLSALESNEKRQLDLIHSRIVSNPHTPKSLNSTLHRSLSPAGSLFPSSLVSTVRKDGRSQSPLIETSTKSRLRDLSLRVSHSQSTPKFDQASLKAFPKDSERENRKMEYQQYADRVRS